MPQLVPVSRAARLVGVSRGELQSRIRCNELVTFEGMVRVSDLLRVFPETKLQDDSAVERAERIKAMATPNTDVGAKLPPAEVLAKRLTELSRDLTESKSETGHYVTIFNELDERLSKVSDLDPQALSAELEEIQSWLKEQGRRLPKVPIRKTELLARDTFLRMIEARVKLIPSGHEYFVKGADTLLKSGLLSGYALRYGCTRGACSKCKARVVSGEVLKVRDHEYVLTDTERNLGYILMCSYTAVTDLVIEADEARNSQDIPQQEIQATVQKLDRLNNDTVALYLQTARENSLRFLAGQMARITLPSGQTQVLPIASCPCDGSLLEFHLRSHPEDDLSTEILQQGLVQDTAVTVSGPTGDFVLQLDSTRPIIFFAYGDGFAFIKSLIESAISVDAAGNYHLYWAVPEDGVHYMENRCRAWSEALDNVDYTPLYLNPAAAETDLRDYFERVINELPDIESYDVYIAAPPTIIGALSASMLSRGLDSKQLLSFDTECLREIINKA